jgi:multimeric flavodoxin WrbA
VGNFIKVSVLGISASPRVGNTTILVKEALKGAEEIRGVDTVFLSLAGKKLENCKGCVQLCHPTIDFKAKIKRGNEKERPWHLCPQKDYMHEIWDAMVIADGIIIGTPVYYGDVSGQLKSMIDRCTALVQIEENGSMYNYLRGKVGAAIAVAGCRNGGQEHALMTIIRFYMFAGIFPVGLPEIEDQGVGVCAYGNNPEDVLKDEWTNWFGQKVSACENARILGKKVAATINQIKKI